MSDIKRSNEKKICNICQKKVKVSFFDRHQAVKHRYTAPVRFRKIMCPLCMEKFPLRLSLRAHIRSIHKEDISEQSFNCNSWEDFVKWLKHEEDTKQFRFVTPRSPKRLQNGDERVVYYCQYDNTRDWKTVADKKRKRAQKYQGSCKMAGSCPAEVIVTKSFNRDRVTVFVQYFSTHVGHEIASAHFRLSRECKSELAEKIKAGISFDKILNDVRDNVGAQQLLRDDLVCRKTLHNIASTLSIDSWKRDVDDATSVSLWIKTLEKLKFNPVCLFKKQGDDHPLLQKSDFILVIITEIQAETLKEFGNRIICVDCTRGINQYAFSLTTILIVDDREEGFPGAFLISNRVDEIVMEIFFNEIRSKLNVILNPTVFMSDDYPAYADAWTRIMKPTFPPVRLLCTWHVDKNWREALNKVGGKIGTIKEKQVSLYRMLRLLLEELDKNKFFELLGLFVTEMMSDKTTVRFGKYFKRMYANRYPMWAYSFREGAGININKIENFHRLIKKVYNRGFKMKRLDVCVDSLMRLVRDKHVERIMKLDRIEAPFIIQKLNATHKRGDDIPDEDVVEEDSYFRVKSQSDRQITYTISKKYENCPYKCNLICLQCVTCVHVYQCSCIDFVIKCRMCKHVHKACILLKKRTTSSSLSTSGDTVNTEIGVTNKIEKLCNSSNNDKKQNSEAKKELVDKLEYLLGVVKNDETYYTTSQLKMAYKKISEAFSCLLRKPSRRNSLYLQQPKRAKKNKLTLFN